MAHSKQLSARDRVGLTAQLGRLLARHDLGAPTDAQPKLAESFEVFLLSAEDIPAATRPEIGLTNVLRRTRQWHHQIVAEGKALGFARTTEPSGERSEWSIHSLFKSDLASKIARATHRIDKERPEHDTEVKLFFAPAYHLYAFLLESPRGPHVLVIDSPFSELSHGGGFYTQTEFLERLRAVPRIRGLVRGKPPTITITPQNVLLTEMKSVTFQSQDEQGAQSAAIWTIAPSSIGKIAPTGAPSNTITYTAPQQITDPQAITITAATAGVSASTTVFLTPISVQIVPAVVQLKHNQPQQFAAIVAGDPTNKVTWGLSPGLGTITPGGFYTPDQSIVDSAALKVTAISTLGSKIASATVTLVPPPWTGWKRNLLGFYLLGVFALVFFLVGLWPPSVPDAQLAQNRKSAQDAVNTDAQNLKRAEDAVASGPILPKDIQDSLRAEVTRIRQQKEKDDKALEDEKKIESASADSVGRPGTSKLENRPGATLPRDIDLLLLVLIGGALGAFLHSARSFTAFVGNEEIKSSWAWWYYLHPFLGAILALTFYTAIRGGFLAVTTGTGVKTSELSPFALTSMAVLVGMFSKNAITKLGELFETLFQPSNPKNLKNPLGPTPQPASGTAPAPKVISITPSSGPAAGGTAVTITGIGFNDGATAAIGGTHVTDVKLTSATSITGLTPPHAVGSVAVEVANSDGLKSALSSAYQYI